MTKEELLEEAKRRYPIGTKIKIPSGTIIEIEENIYFDREDLNIIWNNGYGRIYDNGKWAEIVSKPEEKVENINEFKKGDYIVTLDVKDISTSCAKKNYCFKQRNNNSYVEPQIDLSGSRSNSNTFLTFDKKTSLTDWRYATPKEIAEYDRIGKPYDVTTLQKKEVFRGKDTSNIYIETKSLVGRYLKALVDRPQCIDCANKNEYFLIQSEDKIYSVDIKRIMDNSNCWTASISEIGKTWELMPEGFEPPKKEFKEEIPEYVECIKSLTGITIGKILLVENNMIIDGKFNNYSIKAMDIYNYFKPSTKEAYDKQQRDLIKPSILEPAYMVDGVCTISPPETKPEIDSWCVKATKENQELLKQNGQFFTTSNYQFSDFGKYYGITKKGKFDIFRDSSYFDKLLTTEEFCKKFNIVQSGKYEALDTFEVTLTTPEEKPQWLENLNDIWPQTVKKQSNKIEVKLIPVKKLIKN